MNYILLNPDCKDLPVFLAGEKGDLGPVDQPVSHAAFSEFLKIRAIKVGLAGEADDTLVSLYAWRRNADTKIDRLFGIDKVKQFLHHSPHSVST
jgi:hypothetical protein